ncbi:MAG: BON domain-containing protein [Pirellulales bacterium]
MIHRIFTASLAVALLVGISTCAWGQGRGGTSSMGGMSAFGSSGMGGSSFGSSGFGGSGMGGSAFGGMGTSSMGGSGMGSSGFGGMGMGMGNSAFGSSGFGQSGMGGGMYGSQGGGQNFVGRDGADMAAIFNQMGSAGNQAFNQMNRNMRQNNGNNRNQQGDSGTQENVAPQVRVRLELGFNPTRPTPSAVTNTLRTRLASILPAQGIAQPDVTLESGVAVLRGVAASENQRQVLGQLISMEPGITSVRNEMTIAPSTGDQN